MQNCRHCGKEIGEGELYCSECRAISGTPKPRRFWIFSIIFSASLLALIGMMLWHGGFEGWNFSWDSLLGRPAAMINGEPISRSDLKVRMKSVRGMVERQYGKDVFAGGRGRVLLANLEKEVLDGMLEERLIAQEAKKLKIQIRDDRVQQEMEKISKEMYGTSENFQAKFKENGIPPDELRHYIRNALLFQELKVAKAPAGADPENYFNAWLMQAKQRAELAIYVSSDGATVNSPSCCGTGGGCGGGGPRAAGPLDPKIENDARKAGMEAYAKSNPAEKGVDAEITDYGCHIQIDISKDGKVVKSYTYQNGIAIEIS